MNIESTLNLDVLITKKEHLKLPEKTMLKSLPVPKDVQAEYGKLIKMAAVTFYCIEYRQ